MKSRPYKLNGKLFRYDFDNHVVEYIYKADAEMIAEEEDWKANHNGRPLVGIDEYGYSVVQTAGLRRENWNNKAERNEYLSEWADEIDEESRCLMAEFEKYELPLLKKGGLV